jgi:(p)ppGpp synthase/HD superfamily hydrolase
MTETTPTSLTDRFADALTFAERQHRGHVRKGTGFPYVCHLLAVAGCVLENGGDEDEAIAALLHDVVEDTDTTVEELRALFGDRVAEIVGACSDASDPANKPPWQERKTRHLEHVRGASASVQLVTGADKLHNLRALLGDHQQLGEALWARFNAPSKQHVLWYYRSMLDAIRSALPPRLCWELTEGVDALGLVIGEEQVPELG